MNERINELWAQATFDDSRIIDGVYYPYVALQYGEPLRLSVTEEQRNKFAELIIKECVGVCTDRSLYHMHQGQTEKSGASGTCGNLIKNHFGVKE